jgi:hypothetical protein
MFWVCAEWPITQHLTVVPVYTQWHLEWPFVRHYCVCLVADIIAVFIRIDKESEKRGLSRACRIVICSYTAI